MFSITGMYIKCWGPGGLSHKAQNNVFATERNKFLVVEARGQVSYLYLFLNPITKINFFLI